jgi:hypothetical protein
MKALICHLLVLPLALGTAIAHLPPSIAAPIVRQVSQSGAQGFVGNGASVTVWAGSGTNIDFTRTGETIQRAWLDDPHAIVVDFDAPLGSRGDANIIHLKRVTGIHFPHLPETKSTLLTVVTRSQYGKKTYLFEVKYGSGTPQYATLAVVPDSQLLTGGVAIGGDRPADWNAVERGLQQAIAQQLITANSPVALRMTHLLTYVRNGMPMQQAIQKAQVTMAVITKLAEMGSSKRLTTTPTSISNLP